MIKVSIRLTNVGIPTVHRIRTIRFNFLVWKACFSSGHSNPPSHSAGYRVQHGGELSFIPRYFFPSDVIPIAMSTVLRARSQSQSTCAQRKFACSEQKLASITEQIRGWKYVYRTIISLSKNKNWCSYCQFIAFIPFDASYDMHFYMSFNKDSSMFIIR